MTKLKQLNEKEAINLFKSGIWKNWTFSNIVKFQLFQDRLCIPFDVFHKAMEDILDRPIWTHEFGFIKKLRNEYCKLKSKPSFQEIMDLIPKNKRVMIFL